jgi:mono/diheme cytochrome c family protein
VVRDLRGLLDGSEGQRLMRWSSSAGDVPGSDKNLQRAADSPQAVRTIHGTLSEPIAAQPGSGRERRRDVKVRSSCYSRSWTGGSRLLLLALATVTGALAGAAAETGGHHPSKGVQHGGSDADGTKEMKGMEHARVDAPKEYRGKENPYWADLDAIIQGSKIFKENCALCHGETGKGDGILSQTLDPKPADFSKSTHIANMRDDYLFWRVSEGGAFPPFGSAMPAFKTVLTEAERWQVLAYEHAISHVRLLMHRPGEAVPSETPAHDD